MGKKTKDVSASSSKTNSTTTNTRRALGDITNKAPASNISNNSNSKNIHKVSKVTASTKTVIERGTENKPKQPLAAAISSSVSSSISSSPVSILADDELDSCVGLPFSQQHPLPYNDSLGFTPESLYSLVSNVVQQQQIYYVTENEIMTNKDLALEQPEERPATESETDIEPHTVIDLDAIGFPDMNMDLGLG